MTKKARQSSKRGGGGGGGRRDSGPPTGRSVEMGDGETDYAAIDVFSISDGAPREDHHGLVQRADSEPEVTANMVAPSNEPVPSYTEETLVPEELATASGSEPMTRERRLTLQQLERFRRAMNKKGRNGRRSRRGRTNGGDMRESFDNLFTDDPSGSSARELRVSVYPWTYWLLGLLIIIATSVFVERVRAHALGYTPEEESQAHDWWKYVVAAVVFAVALGFICNGRVETLVMHKDTGTFALRSAKPLCVSRLRRERRVERELRSIADIRVEASGEFSGDVDTRCYKVHFEFVDGSHASALESRSKRKTLCRCREIKDFLFSSLSTTDVIGLADDVDSPDAAASASAAVSAAGKYASPSPLPTASVPAMTSMSSIAAAPLASIPSASLPRKVSTATAAVIVFPAGDSST